MTPLDSPAARPRYRATLAVLTAAVLAGCGGTDSERFVPVAGRVTLDGKGLPLGSVTFKPDASRGNKSLHNPVADIAPDGNFELYTTGKKGAPLGWYKVLVFADANMLAARGGAHPATPKWMVNEKYIDEKTTDLSVEVVESPAPGRYDFKVSK